MHHAHSADIYSVIAISGLGGHAFGSFKQRNGSYMWLRDFLPREFPTARILTYGYSSKLSASESFQDLEAIAAALRTSIKRLLNANSVGFSKSRNGCTQFVEFLSINISLAVWLGLRIKCIDERFVEAIDFHRP